MPDGINQTVVVPYFNLSGGQNDTVSEVNVGETEGLIYRNVNLDRDGAVVKRLGATKLNTSPTGAGEECGMFMQFLPTGGVAETLCAFGDKILRFDNPGFTTLLSGLASDKVMIPAPFLDLCYFMNNSDVPLVYNPSLGGSNIFRSGAPRPATLTKTADVAGSLTPAAVVKCRVRFQNESNVNFFGDPFPAAGLEVTVAAAGGFTLTLPTYTPSGIDYRLTQVVIERTTEGGGDFYEVDRVALGTATYDILGDGAHDPDDVALIEGNLMPDDGYRQTIPKLWPYCVYKRRIVGFDPDNFGRLVFSEIDEFGLLPEFITDFSFHQLDISDAEDAPQMLLVDGEYLIAYCGRSIHLIHIDGAGNSYARRRGGYQLGIPGPRAGVELPDGHLLWTYKGPYLWNRSQMIPVVNRIEVT